MEEFLAEIRRELPPEQSSEVYATLAKVMGNIIRNPCAEKYRNLKKSNKMVAENICTSMAAVSALFMVGFEDQGDVYHCPMNTHLEQMKAATEILEHMTMSLDILTQPAPPAAVASGTGAVPKFVSGPKPALRLTDEEKQRAQQHDQLQALREAQRARHRDSTAGPAAVASPEPRQPMVDLLSGEAPPGRDCVDLLFHDAPLEPALLLPPEQLPGGGTQSGPERGHGLLETRKPPPKTVYDFQRRGQGQQQQQASESLEEARRRQKEKFQQFQSDPNARTSLIYSQAPSGVLGPDGSTRAPAVAGPGPGSGGPAWLEGLKGTSERLTAGLSDASAQLSRGLSEATAGLGALLGPKGPTAEEEGTAQFGSLPGRFRVVSRGGALVRQGVEKDSATVDMLHHNAEFVGLELARSKDGSLRLRLEAPLCGWLTLKRSVVERVPEQPPDEFG